MDLELKHRYYLWERSKTKMCRYLAILSFMLVLQSVHGSEHVSLMLEARKKRYEIKRLSLWVLKNCNLLYVAFAVCHLPYPTVLKCHVYQACLLSYAE